MTRHNCASFGVQRLRIVYYVSLMGGSGNSLDTDTYSEGNKDNVNLHLLSKCIPRSLNISLALSHISCLLLKYYWYSYQMQSVKT